eukprot:CAMPEP_0114171530 /NCGR_PEP_ID=MMETSP0043_2-20121206/34747_1 /TAXON_ID=464988 /ORGANISM="Hemiselmis andersenii, Strain CCMP644" /LENGTH=85 /DNA_ID=CAMNT_0001269257 /DNA_START=1411 /DNA_END=1669 /DNA_ORIENTATION=+
MTNMLVWLSPRLALPPLNAAAQAATAPVALPKEHPECEEATREAQRKCHSKRCDSSTKHQKAATPHTASHIEAAIMGCHPKALPR